MTVFTIGYEGLSVDVFMARLAEYDIETVVDVRELPLSRKPGFSKAALAYRLNLAGFEYAHMGQLGCPKPVRDAYRKDGDWKRYTKGFMKHLKTQDIAIAQLSEQVMRKNCVLLCYEANPSVCHRSMVATAVRNLCGVNVLHIGAMEIKAARPALAQSAFA